MKKIVLSIAVIACLAAAGTYAFYWTSSLRYLEKTDNAYLKADTITISPEISGHVAEVLVRDNQWVTAGQPLVRIDPDDYQAKLEQQEAVLQSRRAALATLNQEKILQRSQINQASATLIAASAQAAKAGLDYRRDQELVGKGYATKEQLDTSKLASELGVAGRDRASAELTSARDQLAVLEGREAQLAADLKQSIAVSKSAQLDLAHASLTAPRSGFIGNRTVEVGRYVRAGTQLMSIIPLDSIYVTANFKETQLRELRPGQSAKVTIDAFPGVELTGVVDSIAPAAGSEFSLLPPENAVGNFTKIVQRVPVRITMVRNDGFTQKLRPGMSVAVTINTRNDNPGPAVVQLDAPAQHR